MAAKKTSKTSKTSKAAKPKNALVANINARKKAGTSRLKKDSTISTDAYGDMQNNWGNSK